jgi:hypothetical protein
VFQEVKYFALAHEYSRAKGVDYMASISIRTIRIFGWFSFMWISFFHYFPGHISASSSQPMRQGEIVSKNSKS